MSPLVDFTNGGYVYRNVHGVNQELQNWTEIPGLIEEREVCAHIPQSIESNCI